MPQTVTSQDLEQGFDTVGLETGDIVCVHSSLSSFGHVEGGPTTVITALLDCIGPAGT